MREWSINGLRLNGTMDTAFAQLSKEGRPMMVHQIKRLWGALLYREVSLGL